MSLIIELISKYLPEDDLFNYLKAGAHGSFLVYQLVRSININYKNFKENRGWYRSWYPIEIMLNEFIIRNEVISTSRFLTDHPDYVSNTFNKACGFNQINLVKLMIEIGYPNLNLGVLDAWDSKNIEIVKYLFDHGATNFDYIINESYEKQKNIKLVKWLINKKIEKLPNEPVTLFTWCEKNDSSMVKFMIEKGANDFDHGLIGACKNANLDLIDLMIKHGATNWNGGLLGACLGNHSNIKQMMIEKGATKCDSGEFIVDRDGSIVSYFCDKHGGTQLNIFF